LCKSSAAGCLNRFRPLLTQGCSMIIIELEKTTVSFSCVLPPFSQVGQPALLTPIT